ncbi:MAG: protein jag [Spirochaetales bacterium]|nr:protein jag [Spirochaetales bacterium]
MIKEFEGKTEKEAIDLAVAELGLEREDFDVEIVETTRKAGFFRKGTVKIRVHAGEDDEVVETVTAKSAPKASTVPADAELEEKLVTYLETVLEKMSLPGKVSVSSREERKICLDIVSEHSNILIGKKGKNLDALQLIINVYAGRIGTDRRIILDMENYRLRREENLVKLAHKAAEQVQRSGNSKLLEPMNPFERRLIHTALNEMDDIDTKSEGEGLYKQVRIIYRGF